MSNIAITPERLKEVAEGYIPNEIIEIVNAYLIQNYRGSKEIIILQDDLVKEITEKLKNTMIDIGTGKFELFSKKMLFVKNWLDFEELYRKKGWKVEYDKPAYCESYDAYWKFTLPKD